MAVAGEGDRVHRKYSPSQSEIFLRCPGAPALLERTPPREQPSYTREGEEAHAVLEAGIKNKCRRAVDAIGESIYCCEPERFDNNFIQSVQSALDYIWDLWERIELLYGDPVLYSEIFVNPPSVAAPGETGGYVDVAIYSPSSHWLWVIDFKHGEGVPKEVEGNTQLLQYGGGFLFEENPRVDPATVRGVTLVILQPRAFHEAGDIREFDTTPAALYDYLTKLEEGIYACQDPRAPLVTGKEQCRFCRAKTICPAVEAKAVGVTGEGRVSFTQVDVKHLPLPSSLDGNRLGHIVQMKSFLVNWLNAVEEHVRELEESGLDVPGVKLVETKPMRRWHYGEEATAKNLAALIGCPVEDVYVKTLPGVTLAEERIRDAFKSRASGATRRKASSEANRMMAFLTSKESSGYLTLVPDDDPRPATNKAMRAFDGIMGNFPVQQS